MKIVLALLSAMMLVMGTPTTANTIHEEGLGQQLEVVVQRVPSYRERLDQMVSRGEIRAVKMEITAYTASVEECGKDDGITASMTKATEGRTVAADTDLFPFGTRLYIDGVGEVIVEDTGGAIEGLRLDIFKNNKDDAWEWGRQIRKVYILGMGRA